MKTNKSNLYLAFINSARLEIAKVLLKIFLENSKETINYNKILLDPNNSSVFLKFKFKYLNKVYAVIVNDSKSKLSKYDYIFYLNFTKENKIENNNKSIEIFVYKDKGETYFRKENGSPVLLNKIIDAVKLKDNCLQGLNETLYKYTFYDYDSDFDESCEKNAGVYDSNFSLTEEKCRKIYSNHLNKRIDNIFDNSCVYIPTSSQLNDLYDGTNYFLAFPVFLKAKIRSIKDKINDLQNYVELNYNLKKFDKENVIDIYCQEAKKNFPELYDRIIQVAHEYNNINPLHIYSMSTTNNNTLMWSHYGNSNKGLCLGFNINDIKSMLNKINTYENNAFISMVSYDKQIPSKLTITKQEYFFGDELQDNLFDLLISYFKSDAWKYENEIRIVLITNSENKKVFLPLRPTTIIFGPGWKDEDINSFINKKHFKNIHYQKAILNNDNYKIMIEDIKNRK